MRHRSLGAAAIAASLVWVLVSCDRGGSGDAPAGTQTPTTQSTQQAPANTAAPPGLGPAQAATQAQPKQPCVPCATQEDFDAAGKKGRTCCPSHTCSSDGDCSGGRVCCRVPAGTLCADSARCAAVDRIKPAGAAKPPPGSCRTSNDCPNAGSDLCCDQGGGKGGKCFGAGSGIKGCAPPP